MTYEKIIQTVFDGENLLISDGMGRSRISELVEARNICFYLGYELTGLSYKKLGEAFNRDHATAMHGVHTIKDLAVYEKKVSAKIDKYKFVLTSFKDVKYLTYSYRVGRFAWMRNRPILNNIQTAI